MFAVSTVPPTPCPSFTLVTDGHGAQSRRPYRTLQNTHIRLPSVARAYLTHLSPLSHAAPLLATPLAAPPIVPLPAARASSSALAFSSHSRGSALRASRRLLDPAAAGSDCAGSDCAGSICAGFAAAVAACPLRAAAHGLGIVGTCAPASESSSRGTRSWIKPSARPSDSHSGRRVLGLLRSVAPPIAPCAGCAALTAALPWPMAGSSLGRLF